MVKKWLNKINSIMSYSDLKKYGYILDSIDDKEIIDLWAKVIDACIDIDHDKVIYQKKPMSLLETNRVVVEFFKTLYGTKEIIEEIGNFFQITSYRKIRDYKYANAQLERSFEIGSEQIRSFCIDFCEDIITSDLIVHEFSHALYKAPIECVYDEVISMTFEMIFANKYHSDLEIFNTITAFNSCYYEGSLKVSADTLKGKIRTIEKLCAKKYFIGYITSLYLLEKYKDDPNVFRRLINLYRDDNNAAKELLKYYGFDFKSNEVDTLLDKDIEKVKKRMYS